MDFPLKKEEIEQIKRFLEIAKGDNNEWKIPITHVLQSENNFVIDFLQRRYPLVFKYGTNTMYQNDYFAFAVFLCNPKEFVNTIEKDNRRCKRLNARDYRITIISSIIGGIVGSIATALLSGLSNS